MRHRSIILLAAVWLAGCNETRTPPAALTPAQAEAAANPAPAASPAPAAGAGENAGAFVATGPVVVENQLDVVALREGIIAAIFAEPGSHVGRGALLAQLDDRQISADLEAATAKTRSIEANLKNWQAEIKVLKADLSRAEKLYAAQVIPQEEVEHARYKEQADEFEEQRETENLNNARATQKSLALEKEKTRITAPFDGLVARRYVRLGQKVAVGDRLFWVTAMGPL